MDFSEVILCTCLCPKEYQNCGHVLSNKVVADEHQKMKFHEKHWLISFSTYQSNFRFCQEWLNSFRQLLCVETWPRRCSCNNGEEPCLPSKTIPCKLLEPSSASFEGSFVVVFSCYFLWFSSFSSQPLLHWFSPWLWLTYNHMLFLLPSTMSLYEIKNWNRYDITVSSRS